MLAAKAQLMALHNDQLRTHLPPLFIRRCRWLHQRLRGVEIDQTVTMFANVSILRYPHRVKLAADAVIKSGVHLCPCNQDSRISVGRRSTIGFYTLLYATSSIEIGDDCMIAPFVYIVDSDHGTRADINMNLQPNRAKPIHIGNDAWVGAHAVILAGAMIGEGAIVGAGAVLKNNVPPYTIVGGVPAKVIGMRK